MEKLTNYDTFAIEQFSYFLTRLAETKDLNGKPLLAISNGGLDANWLNAHGIPTVTLGCGQMNVHTTSEMLDLAAFRDACRIALWLATSG